MKTDYKYVINDYHEDDDPGLLQEQDRSKRYQITPKEARYIQQGLTCGRELGEDGLYAYLKNNTVITLDNY